MIKIGTKKELNKVNNLPVEVREKVEEAINILDDNYGEDRDIKCDLGGCLIIIEDEDGLEELKRMNIDLNIPEYVDRISSSNGDYTSSLILLSSDYSVSLVIPFEITPKVLKDKIES